jgi:hypothetical protein
MSYTTPPTFVSGDILTAAELNVLGDDIVYLYGVAQGVTFSGTKVRRAANQSISDSTDTSVSFDTETFDYGGWYTSGTKVIVPSGAIPSGYTTIAVRVDAAAKFASNGTGKRRIQVFKNGSLVAGSSWTIGALSGDVTDVQLPATFTVVAADEITLIVYQTSGGALNISEATLTVVRIGAVA